MKILNVAIKNYKSINESELIQLHESFNIFAGKNNTGKSAFIEAIYNVLSGNRLEYLSIEEEKIVKVNIEVKINDEELNLLYKNVQEGYIFKSIEKLKLTFHYDVTSNSACLINLEMYNDGDYKPFYTNKSTTGQINYLFFNERGIGQTMIGGAPQFILNLYEFLKSKIVYISGSRHVPSVESALFNQGISIDGSNLNSFMYTLHNNFETTFDIIKGAFMDIFDDVTSISTPIKENNVTQISLYFEGLEEPIPLSNCGSGYTHVLLLLCVLYTKKDSVVLFDEPQVYLHPSAEKAIYDLIGEIGEHQYLFTTHSPILINYPLDKNIYHVSKEKGISIFSKLDEIQKILSDIGVNNSDFALSDRVIFVEGETEEIVIPKILSHFGIKQIGYNYRVLNMKGTGNEFSKKSAMHKHKEKLELILGGVSHSPIPYMIIIDSDNKTEEKLNEIRENYSNSIIILDRREYENYFLDCYREIADIINEEKEEEITDSQKIKSEIDEITSIKDDKKLYPRNTDNILKDVVGSEVLERVFQKYSLTYSKVRNGLQLTDLVLERAPEKLEFFKNELSDFINKN